MTNIREVLKMEYHKAFIKLYGACGAAIETLENKNYGQCYEILKIAIDAAEEIPFEDEPELNQA